jgi:hypothetical protein
MDIQRSSARNLVLRSFTFILHHSNSINHYQHLSSYHRPKLIIVEELFRQKHLRRLCRFLVLLRHRHL